jgi:hypothetical protein
MVGENIYAAPRSLEELFNILDEELIRGWANFVIYAKLQEAFDEGKFTKADWFLPVIHEAVRRESIMSLSRVALDYDNTVTVWTLLKRATNKTKEFKRAQSLKIVRDAAKQDSEFLTEHVTSDIIKDLRDRTLAHTDKKHLNNPAAVAPPDLWADDVRKLYDDLLQIVNRYRVWFNGFELKYDPMTQTQVKEFHEVLDPYFAARENQPDQPEKSSGV